MAPFRVKPAVAWIRFYTENCTFEAHPILEQTYFVFAVLEHQEFDNASVVRLLGVKERLAFLVK